MKFSKAPQSGGKAPRAMRAREDTRRGRLRKMGSNPDFEGKSRLFWADTNVFEKINKAYTQNVAKTSD